MAYTQVCQGGHAVCVPRTVEMGQDFDSCLAELLVEVGRDVGFPRTDMYLSGKKDEQMPHQQIDLLWVVILFQYTFHIDISEQSVDGSGIWQIDDSVNRQIIILQEGVVVTGKMDETVFESFDGLIDLGCSWGVEQKCIFPGSDGLRAKLYFHRGDQVQEKIVAASAGPVDLVAVWIRAVVVAVGWMEHGETPL